MNRILFLTAVASLALHAGAAEPQTAPAEGPDLTRLFNGKDLTGWEGDPAYWSIKDGVIRGETTPENPAKGNTFLILDGKEFGDFELRLSVRGNASNNSGVQYRSQRQPFKPDAPNKWRMKGYQHEVRNEKKLPNVSGFIYDEGGKRGRVCLVGEKAVWADGKKQVQESLIDQAAFEGLFKLDQWNEIVILAKGNRLQHFLNGRLITDFTDDPALALLKGKIGLQLHAGKPMWVEFKDIRIKELK
jgi:hypothetical protein